MPEIGRRCLDETEEECRGRMRREQWQSVWGLYRLGLVNDDHMAEFRAIDNAPDGDLLVDISDGVDLSGIPDDEFGRRPLRQSA